MKILTAALCVAAAAVSIELGILPAEAATEKVLYSFCSQQLCKDGAYPAAAVVRVKSQLYATTTDGGAQWGTVVAVNWKTGAAQIVDSFDNFADDAALPEAALINMDHTLYGTTVRGGSGDGGNGAGAVYSILRRTGSEAVLYSFCSETNCADGAAPTASLLAESGQMYGTTVLGGGGVLNCLGGYPGCGTLFSLDPLSGVQRVLYRFCQQSSCADGSRPTGSLISVGGVLYGTTSAGGNGSGCNDTGLGCGIVFAFDPGTGTETVLHTFAGEAADGGAPAAGLLNVNGTLYGATQYGGGFSNCGNGDGCGTIFSIDSSTGAEVVFHSFQPDGKDGQNPLGSLIKVKGKLYGTTQHGGAHGYGTVFSLDLSTGREKILYAFCSLQRCNDGAYPSAGLIYFNGTLYGTTEEGGAGNPDADIGAGTVFSITL